MIKTNEHMRKKFERNTKYHIIVIVLDHINVISINRIIEIVFY